jgi:hypothetical protein
LTAEDPAWNDADGYPFHHCARGRWA